MRKIIMIFCIILTAAALSSCGKYGKLQNDIDRIEIQNSLSDPWTGAVLMEQTSEAVYNQQLGLCEMYIEAYEKTDIDSVAANYSDLNRDKVLSRLNEARQDFNSESTEKFEENMLLILQNVSDCSNIAAYTQKCEAEVVAFYDDYRRYSRTVSDRNDVLCEMLLKYSKLENTLANTFLQENSAEFTEAAICTIEKNAAVTSDYRANVNKNNTIIDAINGVFGGADSDGAKRINEANKTLVIKLLDSMETITDDERKSLMEQLENGKEMTLEFEKTKPASGTAKNNRTR